MKVPSARGLLQNYQPSVAVHIHQRSDSSRRPRFFCCLHILPWQLLAKPTACTSTYSSKAWCGDNEEENKKNICYACICVMWCNKLSCLIVSGRWKTVTPEIIQVPSPSLQIDICIDKPIAATNGMGCTMDTC